MRRKRRFNYFLVASCLALSAVGGVALLPVRGASAAGAIITQEELNEKLIVKYAMDETNTAAGNTIFAYNWDTVTQAFVRKTGADATIQNSVPDRAAGVVKAAEGVEGSGALSFTGSAHARANFQLPSSAAGMTVSMWVKNINSYWSSLIEFWDGTNGGRFGKGTMQGNGGRQNEDDAWSSNCPAHNSATIAAGGGWDSFCINVNSSDNGGTAVDPMKADTWYHVAFVVTSNEVKAYRNGELKQTFDKGNATSIASSIMTAAKSSNGKLGIRLSLDTNDGDIIDDLRIYGDTLTADEVKASYDVLGNLISASPEYYDVEGLGYPTELLFDGATSVNSENGKMTGVTSKGVSYSYTPLTLAVNDTTPANDEKGVNVTFTQNGMTFASTVKFRRTLKVKAETLGYKIGSGAAVSIGVPEHSGEDIIIKVTAGTDLSSVTAGDISVKKLHESSNAENYKTQFTYSAKTHTATVRCSYSGYEIFDTVYTIKFIEKSTGTFEHLYVTGGTSGLDLSTAELTENSAEIAVNDLESFSLELTLTLADGARLDGSEGSTKTFTQSDLQEDGKLSFTVINENGDSTTYYLIPVVYSTDATLKVLSAEGYTLGFEANKTDYTLTVDRGEGAKLYAALTATANDENAVVKTLYDVTEGVITITVTAEDGVTSMRYVITLIERDTDATLAEIRVNGAVIADFAPETTQYTVKYRGEQPNVTAISASTKAAAAVGDADADGKVLITVTAENGTTKVYTVVLVKESSDASLKKLTLSGTQIPFEGNSGTYTAPIGVRLITIVVNAEVAEGATYTYKTEDGNKIIVTVTAEDGTTATYTVTVAFSASAPIEGGITEDNSPETGGCSSSLSGAAIPAILLVLSVGILAAFKKNGKRDECNRKRGE